ncbi:phosphoserine phosphatase activity protein [Scheffersomyces xylosifermentans]|uniref:phosphoserine phosphatase activity protein n=1 Tax=Scheffersomyces xylosifermentans TaxID=1304137 RepID=UPI00315DE83F
MSDLYALTVIAHGSELPQESLEEVKALLSDKLAVEKYTSKVLSKRAVDFFFKAPNPAEIQKILKDELLTKFPQYDLVFQLESSRKTKKLFIFDMDSTLIYQEVIELIAAYANIEDKVAEITERAMNGELDFNESLAERVQLLKGIDASSIWEELKHKIEITNGAKDLCTALKKLDVVMGVCSGGFIPLAEHVKGQLGLDYAYANVLGTDENLELDGTTIGPIVNGEKKAELLLEIAKNHKIDPKDAVAVGDGANDLKMMSVAGFGIAWNAKPKVQKLAPSCLNTKSLLDVLYILGYNEEEITKLTS